MPLILVFLRSQKLVSTKTPSLKYYYRRQGIDLVPLKKKALKRHYENNSLRFFFLQPAPFSGQSR